MGALIAILLLIIAHFSIGAVTAGKYYGSVYKKFPSLRDLRNSDWQETAWTIFFLGFLTIGVLIWLLFEPWQKWWGK